MKEKPQGLHGQPFTLPHGPLMINDLIKNELAFGACYELEREKNHDSLMQITAHHLITQTICTLIIQVISIYETLEFYTITEAFLLTSMLTFCLLSIRSCEEKGSPLVKLYFN